MRFTTTIMAAALVFAAAAASAEEVDRKTILEMLPCKSAALRLCDRSQGITVAALWSCGATLAERHLEVSQRCVKVLKRFGQM